MISLQSSMHSSQMYTPPPAISFLTCFWLLPQKEHLSRSALSCIRAMKIFLLEEFGARSLLMVAVICYHHRCCDVDFSPPHLIYSTLVNGVHSIPTRHPS